MIQNLHSNISDSSLGLKPKIWHHTQCLFLQSIKHMHEKILHLIHSSLLICPDGRLNRSILELHHIKLHLPLSLTVKDKRVLTVINKFLINHVCVVEVKCLFRLVSLRQHGKSKVKAGCKDLLKYELALLMSSLQCLLG